MDKLKKIAQYDGWVFLDGYWGKPNAWADQLYYETSLDWIHPIFEDIKLSIQTNNEE